MTIQTSDPRPVRFVDLPAQFAEIRPEVDRFLDEIFTTCRFAGGPEVDAFEEEFARFCGAPWCVGVASGTEALRLALTVAGVGPGDEVVTVPNTFFATAAAISTVGAVPVFVDVDPETLLMQPDLVSTAIGPRTRAILPVHLFGAMVDIEALEEIARPHGLTIVVDACQAHGATMRGARAGASGHLTCFSFYPAKNLGGVGEGGAVVGGDPAARDSLRALRAHGQVEKNRHALIGLNAHLDAINAGILRIKLRRLEGWNRLRRRWADRYGEAFSRLGVPFARTPAGCESAHHLFPVLVPDRDELRRRLAAEDIESGLHYPVPIHLQEAYRGLGLPAGSYPVAERWAAGHVTLPLHPHLAEADVDRIVATVERHLQSAASA